MKTIAILILLSVSASAQAPHETIDGMEILNQQRIAAGLQPFTRDPALMEGAMDKCVRSATRRFRGHLGGSFFGANREGCGMSSRFRFNSCYALDGFPADTRAGAAMVRGPDGWHSLLLIKSTSRSGGRFRTQFRRFRIFR